MNKIILFGFIFLLFPLNNSFGESKIFGDADIFVFVQTTVRNADGQLVLYLESTKFTDLNMSALESFLDFEASRGNDPVFLVDESQFQAIRRVQSQTIDSEDLVASTVLFDKINDQQILLARFAHDGYYVIPGDTLESIWTFVRPVT